MLSGRVSVGRTRLRWPAAGIRREDIARLDLVLAGVRYPALKWQIIDYAVERMRALWGSVDPAIADWLWTLPPGLYADYGQVLVGIGQTARGRARGCAHS